MKAWKKTILMLMALFFTRNSWATTGIDSVGYLWVIGLILLGVVLLLVWALKILRKVKADTQSNNKSNDT